MRVTAWCSFMTDLSGRPVSEADWHTELSPTTGALLHELGRHYAPFLVANAESLGRVSCSDTALTFFWRFSCFVKNLFLKSLGPLLAGRGPSRMRAARRHAVVAAILPLRREVPPVAAGGLRRSARRGARDGGRCAGGQRGRGELRNLYPLAVLR